MKETLLGRKLKEDYSMKKCCNVCGFPVDLPRNPVVMTNNMVIILHYDEDVCVSCGHQFNGSTIPVVHKHWTEMCNKFLNERNNVVKFLKHYSSLMPEQREDTCLILAKCVDPSYVWSDDDTHEMDPEHYSWARVYRELIDGTRFSRTLINNIDWEELSKGKL